jgi:transcriptional regulator with XRE-family HTH domain
MKKEFLYGRRIKELREQRGWTQEQLAEAADIESTRTIQRVERDQTKGPETLLAIAGALDVDLGALRITRRIAESELVRVQLAKTVREFISAENTHRSFAFSKGLMVSLRPEAEDQVSDLMKKVFSDREYIDRDEPYMWDSYLDCIKEPLQELFDFGFAFLILDERRDILLNSGNGLTPIADHIPNQEIRYYLLIVPHGSFQIDANSPLHRFNGSCPLSGETLLKAAKTQDLGILVYANALIAVGQLGDESRVCWCDTCFPPSHSGPRIGFDYIEQVTGLRREQLQCLYEAEAGDELFMEGLS